MNRNQLKRLSFITDENGNLIYIHNWKKGYIIDEEAKKKITNFNTYPIYIAIGVGFFVSLAVNYFIGMVAMLITMTIGVLISQKILKKNLENYQEIPLNYSREQKINHNMNAMGVGNIGFFFLYLFILALGIIFIFPALKSAEPSAFIIPLLFFAIGILGMFMFARARKLKKKYEDINGNQETEKD